MNLSTSNRAALVTFFAWLILVCITQLIRGDGIVPPAMSAFGFWSLMSFIGLLLALLVKVITAIFLLMANNMK